MTNAKKNEVAVVEKFSLVTGLEAMDEDTKAELADEIGDLDDDGGIEAKHIKIPSGGGKAYEVETDNPDDPDVMKEVEGVIIFTHKMNAYWAHAFREGDADGNQNRMPDCSSMDGKQGIFRESGEVRDCASCPYNQFGSAGRGKACKNMRRLYIMMSGKPDIYLLTVPPTSIRDVNKTLRKIMMTKHIPYSRMVMKFGLAGAESGDGIKYSRVTIDTAGMLPEPLWTATQKIREELKNSYENVAITTADYEAPEEAPKAAPQAAAPKTDVDGFMSIPDGVKGEELPFE